MSAFERLRDAEVRAATANDGANSELGEYGVLVGGEWMKSGDAIEVHSPYDDSLVAIVHQAGPEEIEKAISKAVEAFGATRKLPSWRRAEILEAISNGISNRHEEFARTIALEAGKPIQTARAEVDRAVLPLRSRPKNRSAFTEKSCL